MTQLVSIIIPIYKVEPYLRRCIDSVLAQTYPNLEIILIDDGSPDGCPAICDEYAAKDNRIKVIHKKNGGLSDARNAGLEIAQGEYLTFIDSDDWVVPQYIEILLKNALDHKADISIGELKKVHSFENNDPVQVYKSLLFTSQQAIIRLFAKTEPSLIAAWGKLFKRSLINQFRFPLNKIHEDEYLNYQWLYKAAKITYTSQVLYFYYQHPNSITGSNKPYDDKEIYNNQVSYFVDKGESSILKTLYSRRLWTLLNRYWEFYQTNNALNSNLVKREIQNSSVPFYSPGFTLKSNLALYFFKNLPFLYIIYKKTFSFYFTLRI